MVFMTEGTHSLAISWFVFRFLVDFGDLELSQPCWEDAGNTTKSQPGGGLAPRGTTAVTQSSEPKTKKIKFAEEDRRTELGKIQHLN